MGSAISLQRNDRPMFRQGHSTSAALGWRYSVDLESVFNCALSERAYQDFVCLDE